MAITKPLTVVAGQVQRQQSGDVLNVERINLGPLGSQLLLVANEITITKSWHQVFISSGTAAQRSLRVINGGLEGDLLILQRSALGADIIVDDAVGNIRSSGDFTLTHPDDKIIFLCDGIFWHELTRSNNTA